MSHLDGRHRPLRVLISDMTPLIASGVEAALATTPSFETRRCALHHVLDGRIEADTPFDIVVLECEPGLRLAGELVRSKLPASIRDARIFVVNQSTGERDIREALEAGIHGYATLSLSINELHEGLRTVARGMRYVCPRSAQRLADSVTREPLTPREAHVLKELARGSCNKSIALELEMALGTVKAHVKALMSKLDAKTRTQVVTVAIARGLVDPIVGSDLRAGTSYPALRAGAAPT